MKKNIHTGISMAAVLAVAVAATMLLVGSISETDFSHLYVTAQVADVVE